LTKIYGGFITKDHNHTAEYSPPETPDQESSYRSYASRFAGRVGRWFLRVQEEAAVSMLAPYQGASILDVGGGHGQLTPALLRLSRSVTIAGSGGADHSQVQVYVDSGQVDYQVVNLLKLPFPYDHFDVVISFRLLPHMRNWETFLSELGRVARQAVLVDYPEVRSINYIAPHLFKYKKQLEVNTRPFTRFHEDELAAVLKPMGFRRKERFPQYFLPMVLHRKLDSVNTSKRLETGFRRLGLTGKFGSPVILLFTRDKK
jgi:2-polyprenyl-3-methyl-5-hydroxy-6-metoxy-1,4-benzoquinol methylase